MSTVRQDVLDNFLTQLRGMTLAAGYDTDWKAGYSTMPEDVPVLYPCWVLEEGAELIEVLAYPTLNWRMRVKIHGAAKASVLPGRDTHPNADAMISDIIRAVMADPTLGGRAIDVIPTGSERLGEVAPDVWVTVDFDVLYRTRLADPRSGL